MNRILSRFRFYNRSVRLSEFPFCTRLIAACLVTCISVNTPRCFAAGDDLSALTSLSLEELGDIKVTSVSKKEERLASAAASIYVITGDAIRRAGARNLPEALRLAPNLLVAQINANKYAISARGFNSSTANKLLVMIDGRTIYTPLYSGVFWDAQDVLLPDVDRIEVISGPGGTLWGANAVNGVINIITKSSAGTTNDLIHTSGGNVERGLAVRHGGTLNNSGSYRVYAKFDQWEHSVRANGAPEPDAWNHAQVGFRSDWRSEHNDFTLQGDAYRNAIDQLAPGQQAGTGANLLGRWNQQLSDGSALRIQTYFDHTTREIPGTYSEKLDTLDLDIQHSLPEEDGNQLIWGGGYRVADDRVGNTAALAFLPADKQLHWANLFAQQERNFWSRWQFTVGGKLERNDYTGVEFLPNLKLAWQASEDKLLWLRFARAVRAPSRIDTEIYIPGNAPYLLSGGPDFRSEIANTTELGFRNRDGKILSYSVVAFHSEYDHLRSVDRQSNGIYLLGNNIEGKVDGVEALLSYQLTDSLLLDASGLYLREKFEGPSLILSSPGNDPHSQWAFGIKWNVNNFQQLDISLRHVGELPHPVVPAYMLLDAHFGWTISSDVELGITGRNLLDQYHQEFASGSGVQALNPIQVERSLDMSLTVRF